MSASKIHPDTIIVDTTHDSTCADCNRLAEHIRNMMVSEGEDGWISDLGECTGVGFVMFA